MSDTWELDASEWAAIREWAQEHTFGRALLDENANLSKRVRELESRASNLVDAMDTCHICAATVHVEEGPIHCEDCASTEVLICNVRCKNLGCSETARLLPMRITPKKNGLARKMNAEKVNILRGVGFSAVNALKTHCPSGHPYSGENLFVNKKGRRFCLACRRKSDAGRPRKAKCLQKN